MYYIPIFFLSLHTRFYFLIFMKTILKTCLFALAMLFSVEITRANAIEVLEAQQPEMPLLTKKENVLGKLKLNVPSALSLTSLEIQLNASLKKLDISELSFRVGKKNDLREAFELAKTSKVKKRTKISVNYSLSGEVFVWILVKTTEKPNLLNTIKVEKVTFTTSQGAFSAENFKNPAQRFGLSLRVRKQDASECYRIPGLVTTNKGTLIAVYDNRYNNCKDLQEDINIGMSRSTDGGQTWEPMKVVMDMKQWGGLSEQENGVGDPAVLVDKVTGTIWVAALWQHGSNKNEMTWWSSKQGMSPQETGQLLLVKSDDDGKSWSEPINITPQTKDPKWHLFFNGPGAGISLKDGKIVFAAQYKDENKVPHSTLIYSDDHGKSWKTGVGAKSHTTEAQVVELSDGSIMLNMRDDRNRDNKDQLYGRSVAVTKDLGASWQEHETSRKALVEPNCMASIISFDKKGKRFFFFSNPADANYRVNMTIKASDDQGASWDKLPQVKLYANGGFGYSCMSIIDEKHIGILYEGEGDLFFQKISISEFIK